jgi:hypothetical protein
VASGPDRLQPVRAAHIGLLFAEKSNKLSRLIWRNGEINGRLNENGTKITQRGKGDCFVIQMDLWDVEKYDSELRPELLKMIKDKLVRGEVVMRYTLIDEFLTDIICDFYFQRRENEVSYRELWKTKRFKIFVQYLMDETFLLRKLAVVEAIMAVPPEVSKAIKRINDVRNALAHSFFPEHRRRYIGDKKVTYKGAHLFSREGVEKFQEDFHVARRFLVKKIFGADVNDWIDQNQ